ncbi:hypothetical protein [Streptomyces sp. SYSU K217416]
MLALWLAAQDTAPVWAATAATAVGVVVVQGLSGLGAVRLPESSLGEGFVGASVTAVVFAAVSAGLAGSALTNRQQEAGPTRTGS